MGSPSVFVMARSAVARTLSVSVEELFAVTGSTAPGGAATAAVLTRVPVPVGVVGFNVPVIVYVALALVGRVAEVAIALPLPLAAPHDAPEPVATQLHETPVIAAGTVSVIDALVAVDGPALATVTV